MCSIISYTNYFRDYEMKLETESDLYREYAREYARVIDMCKGTDVQPFSCVSYKDSGSFCFVSIPTFTGVPELYSFAIGLIEGKPVFIGDTVWSTTLDNGTLIKVEKAGSINSDWFYCSSKKFKSSSADFRNCLWDKPLGYEFQEIKDAILNGDRVVVYIKGESWVEWDLLNSNSRDYILAKTFKLPRDSYKIVGEDEFQSLNNIPLKLIHGYVNLKFKVCGITQKLSVEII